MTTSPWRSAIVAARGGATRRPFGLSAHLLAFALLLVLPALGIGALAVRQAVDSHRATFRARLEDTARALALAVDAEIGAHRATVGALAGSVSLDGPAPSLATFQAEARRASRTLGTSLILLDPESLRQLVNTALPPGEPPGAVSAAVFRRVAEQRQPLVTDLIIGAVAGRPVSGVAVPVERDGQLRFILASRIEPARLAELIRAPRLTGGAMAAIVDGQGLVVARSRQHERFVGQPATAWYRDAVIARPDSGFLHGRSLEEQEVALGFAALSAAPGWTVTVVVPWAEYAASGSRPLAALALGGAMTLGLGLLLALGLAQRLLRPVRALAADAGAVVAAAQHGLDPPPPATPPSGIAEFAALSRAITAAEDALRERAVQARAAEERFRLAAEGTGLGTWDLDGATGRLVWSRHHFLMLGHPPAPDGKALLEMWRDCVHPEDLPAIEAEWARTEREGELFHVTYRIRRADNGEQRWVESFGRHLGSGTPPGPRRFVGVIFDVTERKASEERQRLLMREVDHRAKNVLAAVQSVLRMTRAREVESFATAVEGRVRALARAHELLARDRWGGAELRALAAEELDPHGKRASIAGPPLRLAPQAVQPVSMVLHELATNAAKYGALSHPEGRVELSWARAASGMLVLCWTERGGPSVPGPPQRRGFGSRLIETTLKGQLGGEARFDWTPEGLCCRMTIAARHLACTTPLPGAEATLAHAAARRPPPGLHVLVAEDEALIAAEMVETLEGLGCVVVGPAMTLAETLRLAGEAALDAAVLDVNLQGEPVFPAAALLAARGVPVVLATGYSEVPEAAGMAVRVLRKPVAPAELAAALGAAVAAPQGVPRPA